MSHKNSKPSASDDASGLTTWGPKLFWAALVAILLFFYWLVIYSGGAVIHHG